jgi:alkylation response protein AidB-like acyl-CoA dehydrogenase
MDFHDTAEEAAFRAKAQAFLKKTVQAKSDDKSSFQRLRDENEYLKTAKAYQKAKAEAGFAGITWAKEQGGQGLPPIFSVIFGQEEAKFDAPAGPFAIGLGMCIPTMIAFATEEQKKRYVGPALRGEEIWCQLFSEPSAGSDVAGLKTKAVRDGDDWVVNGQKVWTSGAHYSDYGILLVRTNPDVAKHKGLTMFFLDMKSPGVEVRPIHQMSGGSNFNEVYFTDAGRRRPGLAGGARHADERAPRGRRLFGSRLQGDPRSRARPRRGRGVADQERRVPRASRRLVRARRGLQARQDAHDDGAVEGPDAGAGKLHRQDHQRQWRPRSSRPTCGRRASGSRAAPMKS